MVTLNLVSVYPFIPMHELTDQLACTLLKRRKRKKEITCDLEKNTGRTWLPPRVVSEN